MKFQLLFLIASVAITYSSANLDNLQDAAAIADLETVNQRLPREVDDPNGSVVLRGEKPLSGPDQRATINLELERKLNEHTNVYGGGHYTQGDRVRPHAGIVYEREFENGYINGRGQVQPGPGGRLEPSFGLNAGFRFRREADPQGSVVLRGEKPLSGPDRRATLNLEYQQKLNEHTSAYGGGHYTQGDRVRPHAGVVYERQFGNGFVNGRGQVQPGPRGRLEPSFGLNAGFRFRREADPQGSVVLRGEKPLSGPDRRATLNLEYQQKLNEHTSAYGGGHYTQGDRVRPHAGVVYERQFGNGFVNGRGQVQPGPRGRLEPSFGLNAGFRFRREADPQGSVVLRGEKPLSGPDRRATLNLEYQQKLNEHTSAYGGGHYTQGDRVRPHAGVVYERQFGNGFVNGRGQVQPGPRGRLEPSFGLNAGFRFRREADPQGSVVLRGEKPLSGPDRRATLNLEYQQKLNEHTSAYGGGHYTQGDRVRPHAGVVYERQFGNGFVNGRGQVQPGPRGRLEPLFGLNAGFRFRREADPQGSVVLRGEKPLSGPDRRATLNLEYQQKLNEHTSAYGGGHYTQGDRVRPHAGVVYERQFGNGFVNGRGQVQPGPRGRLEPSFGLNAGFRFRREADPQGSVVLRGEKPLSGPDRRATLNLEYQQKLNEHTSAYGGGHYTQGDRVRPHAGVVYERQFGNGFVNGRGQVQPGPRGRLEPSFGLNAGFRFRREADPQGSVVLRGEKPLSGPDRRATLNLEYQQKLNEHTSAYGGGHYTQGDRVRPHAGVIYERQFGNGFVNGRGQVQPGPRGRLEPSFGLNAGFRFRRDADEKEEEEESIEEVEEIEE